MINKSYLNCIRRLGDVPGFVKTAVANVKYQQRVASLKAKGAIPLSEIKKDFEKVSWDLFRKTVEPDYGSIWVVTTIKNANGEDEKWLTVYTDENDRVVRQVKASKKTAQEYLTGDNVLVEGIISQIRGSEDQGYDYLITFATGETAWISEQDITKTGKKNVHTRYTVGENIFVMKESSINKTSSKTSHTPGTIVQINVPHGNLYEKYNGKIGEVVAAVPDRSKVSFKDLPSTWFEDNIIRPVSLCPICNAKMSLQMLKKLGTLKCKCGASYSKRQLEKIVNKNRINKVASEKVAQVFPYENKIDAAWNDLGELKNILDDMQIDCDAEKSRIERQRGNERLWHDLLANIEGVKNRIEELEKEDTEKITAKIEPSIELLKEYAKSYWVAGDFNAIREDLKEQGLSEKESEEFIAQYGDKIEELSEYIPKEELKEYLGEEWNEEKEASIKKAKIVEKGNEFCVIAESGRSMGCYPSRKKAEERLQQVEMFKHMKGKKAQEIFNLGERVRFIVPSHPYYGEFGNVVEKYPEEGKMKYRIKFDDDTTAVTSEYWIIKTSSKKAQNVIFWFDSPNALKALKHLQGPPISPAKEPSEEEPEDLEEVDLEPKEEVEKEASKKTAQRNFEVGDIVQIMDKEENTTIVPKATIAQIDEYLGKDGNMHETIEITGSKDEDEQEWYNEEEYSIILLKSVEASIKKEAVKLYFSNLDDLQDALNAIDEVIYDGDYDVIEEEGVIIFKNNVAKKAKDLINDTGVWYKEIKKKTSIKKEADGTEVLRGGGGAGSDKLEPMSWSVKETKTPKIPEKVEEQEEPTEEEVEEIHVVVNPETKDVHVSFEGEEGEKIEEEKGEPTGAETPTTEEKEPETEEVEEEGEGMGGENIPVNF